MVVDVERRQAARLAGPALPGVADQDASVGVVAVVVATRQAGEIEPRERGSRARLALSRPPVCRHRIAVCGQRAKTRLTTSGAPKPMSSRLTPARIRRSGSSTTRRSLPVPSALASAPRLLTASPSSRMPADGSGCATSASNGHAAASAFIPVAARTIALTGNTLRRTPLASTQPWPSTRARSAGRLPSGIARRRSEAGGSTLAVSVPPSGFSSSAGVAASGLHEKVGALRSHRRRTAVVFPRLAPGRLPSRAQREPAARQRREQSACAACPASPASPCPIDFDRQRGIGAEPSAHATCPDARRLSLR